MAEGLLQRIARRAEVVYPILVVLLAAALFLPRLGSFGLWDPQEFQVADQAQKTVETGNWDKLGEARPPLTPLLTAAAVDMAGPSELSARLPHALLAILGVLAAYGIGRRLRSARAGFFAAVAVATAPVFLFQARQLATDMGGVAGSAIAIYGLIGLAWPVGKRRGLMSVVDGLAAAVGLLLSYLAYGAVIGLGVPLTGVAVAAATSLVASLNARVQVPADASGAPYREKPAVQLEDAPSPSRLSHTIVALVTGLAVVVVLVMWWMARDAKGYDDFLGGSFRQGPATTTFDELIDDGAFGLFPWVALAPLAVLRLAFWRTRGRAAYGGLVLVGWATASYVLGALWVREMGELRFPGVVPALVAVGVLLDDVLAAEEGQSSRAPGLSAGGWPLFALFALCCAVQLARDIGEFPEQLARVHVLGSMKFPEHLAVSKPFAWLGILFGLISLAAFIRIGRFPRLGRWSVPALVAVGALGGFYLAQVYTPTLSQHYSNKNVFAFYRGIEQPGDHLSVSGIAGSSPEFYMNRRVDRVSGLDQVVGLLGQETRQFIIGPATDLCPLELRAQQKGVPYHVIHSANSRYFLYGNTLPSGVPDANPLRRMLFTQKPDSVGTPLSFTFKPPGGGEIELIGVDMPQRVEKRSTFKMKLFFHVKQQWTGNYKLLMHFDKRVRFQADHAPLGGLCGTQYWQTGDYVVDEFEVTAGELTSPKGDWDVYTGFFTGEAGNWKNVPVTSGNGEKDDRVHIGKIVVY